MLRLLYKGQMLRLSGERISEGQNEKMMGNFASWDLDSHILWSSDFIHLQAHSSTTYCVTLCPQLCYYELQYSSTDNGSTDNDTIRQYDNMTNTNLIDIAMTSMEIRRRSHVPAVIKET